MDLGIFDEQDPRAQEEFRMALRDLAPDERGHFRALNAVNLNFQFGFRTLDLNAAATELEDIGTRAESWLKRSNWLIQTRN